MKQRGFFLLALLAVLALTAWSQPTDGGDGTVYNSGAYSFTTPARYREMILVTPDAVNSVTITGDSAYNAADDDTFFPSGRSVTLSPFRIAKYETTWELWYEVYTWATHTDRGANQYTFANPGRQGGNSGTGATGTKLHPVTRISWRDAVVWCNAYSELSGKEPVYYTDSAYTTVLRVSTDESGTSTAADVVVVKTAANGYRLPTEAQWEYAARGGKTPSASTFAYKWAGANTETGAGGLGDYAWYSANADGSTHPAGGKRTNTLGLHDMSGNVWEWCWDWYESPLGTEQPVNPAGPASGLLRVIRSGGWSGGAVDCEVSYRDYDDPYGIASYLGVRVSCP
jgi:formylglycine-generating enzyme required for sulfatase activity